MEEKTINFKIDSELYKEIKIKVAKEGKTMKQYTTELIKRDLNSDK